MSRTYSSIFLLVNIILFYSYNSMTIYLYIILHNFYNTVIVIQRTVRCLDSLNDRTATEVPTWKWPLRRRRLVVCLRVSHGSLIVRTPVTVLQLKKKPWHRVVQPTIRWPTITSVVDLRPNRPSPLLDGPTNPSPVLELHRHHTTGIQNVSIWLKKVQRYYRINKRRWYVPINILFR